MGSVFGRLLSSFMSKPEMRILMVGLDAAGKVCGSDFNSETSLVLCLCVLGSSLILTTYFV